MLRRLHSLIAGSRDVSQSLDASAAHHHHHQRAGEHPPQLIAQPREGPVPRGLLQSGVDDHNEFHTICPRASSNSEEEEEQARTTSSINNDNMSQAAEETSCDGNSSTSCREKYEDAFRTVGLHESSSNSVVENGEGFSRGEVSGTTDESHPAIAIAMAKGVQLDEGFTAIDISKEEEEKNLGKGGGGLERTISMLSLDNLECCRICQQQHTDEPLIDLGCSCRGELAKAHRSCIDMWFKNKGSNKCEVCQHVAANIPAPASQPIPHFWVWRVGGPYTVRQASSTYSVRAHFQPLWAAMLILVAGLLFDVLISIFLGASALPVNIIIGVLVVLGLGTAVRLILECCHERIMRRNLRRLELQSMSSAYEAPLQVVTQSSDVQAQTQPPAQSTESGA